HHQVLEGQGHDASPEALATAITDFFTTR
ncbi:hypothetical protein ABH927_006703, partial [Planotetraspora sp. GP83]